ncbi:putative ribosomal N-acetyltransferase YdaF [Symmachiella macrocystis]|uniref:Putative ribosomal N-acetyltransferase YdaF n=1 Tax=Symmachiella macrocystis TaxID=2527985 RepID=A0A5C6BQL5_9PLAN|nr:GNAT family N-acetyltransferase [Symmachiella macrocystis]TWU14493.1 putative ribosomal N-acetyltransferase YdaF [Symmachiella macrocystis]
MRQPTLLTKRLTLRPYQQTDAPRMQQLAGERVIAATTLRIPHPYADGVAEEWIASALERTASGNAYHFAMVLTETDQFLGSVGLTVQREWERAELGYWIGVPYWGRGYTTEAAMEITRFGFEDLGLNRIYASVFANNPASARVLEKAGLTYEGRHLQAIKKWDEFLDTLTYARVKQV